MKIGKIPAPRKIKSALPPPQNAKYPPPPQTNESNLSFSWAFLQKVLQCFQASIRFTHPFLGPELRHETVSLLHEDFSVKKKPCPHARNFHSRLKFSFSVWNFHSRLSIVNLGLCFSSRQSTGPKMTNFDPDWELHSILTPPPLQYRLPSLNIFNPGALWVRFAPPQTFYRHTGLRGVLAVPRFLTQSSVSFFGPTEFRFANSVSSYRPIICEQMRTHRVSGRTHRVCRRAQWVLSSETVFRPIHFSLPKIQNFITLNFWDWSRATFYDKLRHFETSSVCLCWPVSMSWKCWVISDLGGIGRQATLRQLSQSFVWGSLKGIRSVAGWHFSDPKHLVSACLATGNRLFATGSDGVSKIVFRSCGCFC